MVCLALGLSLQPQRGCGTRTLVLATTQYLVCCVCACQVADAHGVMPPCSLGSTGQLAGHLSGPMGLALGALAAQDGAFEAHQAQAHTSSAVHNLLAVADCGNDRVQVFDLDALICSDAVAGDQDIAQMCATPPPG